MTAEQLWAALLSGTLLTTILAGLKFIFDAVTGRRVRRVIDGEAELRLAEMVKKVAADEVETLTKRLERHETLRASNANHIETLQGKVATLERERANDLTEIAGLQRRVTGVIEDRDDLVRYIGVLQVWVASGATPPAPAIPEHLADVLPAWTPVDGAKPPVRARPGGID